MNLPNISTLFFDFLHIILSDGAPGVEGEGLGGYGDGYFLLVVEEFYEYFFLFWGAEEDQLDVAGHRCYFEVGECLVEFVGVALLEVAVFQVEDGGEGYQVARRIPNP